MAISLQSLQRGVIHKPPRILLVGVRGIGKTTFGAEAPKPVFIQTEDGSCEVDVDRFPLARSYEDVVDALSALYQEDHDFQTVVLDTIDWLEPLVWAKTSQTHSKDSIEEFGYGKGYVYALDWWRQILTGLTALRDERNMQVIMISHCQIRTFQNPETEPYDRYEVKLHKSAAALVEEYADIIGFANYKILLKQSDAGFGKTKSRPVGEPERWLYLSERPAFVAKNRMSLPDSVPFRWAHFAAALDAARNESKSEPEAPAKPAKHRKEEPVNA